MSAQPIGEAKDPHGSLRSDTGESTTPERLSKRTRTSRAWAAITVGLAGLVVVLVFVLQNRKDVEVKFLSLSGQLPLAILLLLVAVLGALIVFAFGAARIVQLQVAARRSRREISRRTELKSTPGS